MNIGVDIDGVLTNIERFQLDYGSKYCFEQYNKSIINPNGYEIFNIFGKSIREDEAYWKEYLKFYVTKEPARPFADEVIKKLSEDGHIIKIITARYLTERDDELGKKMRNIVKTWLKENNIYYDELIFSPEDKKKVCKKNNIDLMIEDSPRNLMELSEVVEKVICFDAKYNQNCIPKSIIRCYSWYDIYYKILNLEK